MSDATDHQLVERCLNGSEESWMELYGRVSRPIATVLRWHRWGFSREEIPDLMQDVCVNLVQSLAAFRFQCSIETFAANLARHTCVTALRKKNARKRSSAFAPVQHANGDGHDAPGVPLHVASPCSAMESEETNRELLEVLNRLEPAAVKLLRLRYYENRSYTEIVNLLHMPRGTVATQIRKCLLALKKIYFDKRGAYREPGPLQARGVARKTRGLPRPPPQHPHHPHHGARARRP